MKLSPRERRRAARAYWEELLSRDTRVSLPTEQQWNAAVKTGLDPDGCTFCPDRIWGVRVGCSSRAFADAHLPCNAHDYHFHVGGGEAEFEAVNLFFYQRLMQAVSHLWRPLRDLAEIRCTTIYHAVRSPQARKHFSWKDRPARPRARAKPRRKKQRQKRSQKRSRGRG